MSRYRDNYAQFNANNAAVFGVSVDSTWANKAFREQTPTRERVCLNGLWRWQPAAAAPDTVPADRWGYFKVPGWFYFTDALPTTGTQKIQKHQIFPSGVDPREAPGVMDVRHRKKRLASG